MLLRRALRNVLGEIDPLGKDDALRQMVMIGHSQGGILTKLMAIRSGNRFWENITKEPFEDVKMAPETRELLREAMFFEPVPTLRRVVFIATPHRGSYQASGWALDLIRRFITLPGTLVSQFQGLAQAQTFASGNQRITDLGGQYESGASVPESAQRPPDRPRHHRPLDHRRARRRSGDRQKRRSRRL